MFAISSKNGLPEALDDKAILVWSGNYTENGSADDLGQLEIEAAYSECLGFRNKQKVSYLMSADT